MNIVKTRDSQTQEKNVLGTAGLHLFYYNGCKQKGNKGNFIDVDGFETEYFWSGGITINHTGDFAVAACC